MTTTTMDIGAVAAERCRVCGGSLVHRWTLTVLGRHQAEYFECVTCGCLQIPNPWWLAEAYRDEDKAKAANPDRGRFCRNFSAYVRLRSLEYAGLFPGPLRVLDYGGGSGLLAAMLRLAGRDCRQFDPHCTIPLFEPDLAFGNRDDIPKGGFNAVVALEVFEHLCDPLDVVRSLAAYLAPGGSLVLSTGIYRPGVHTADWPYLSRPAGQHVTFYTRRALRVLADGCGLPHVCLFPSDEGFLILLTSGERRRVARCLQWAAWALRRRRLLAEWTAGVWDIHRHADAAMLDRPSFVE